MKKIILSFGSVLLGIFVGLSILDSGSEYAMEKKLWYAQKQFEIIARDPKSVPDKNFDELIARYEGIIRQHPDSDFTPKIYTKIGKIYIMRQNYVKARESYQEVLKRYPKNSFLCADALLNVGNSYRDEGNRSVALKTYREIQDRYPLTLSGINMPLFIADFYLREKNVTESANALRDAIGFYQKIAQEHPHTEWEFQARWLLSTTYFSQQKWDLGLQALGGLLQDFSNSEYMNRQSITNIIKTINTVAAVNMKSFDPAISLYKNFIAKNPDNRLNSFLQANIKALQELKDKNVSLKIVEPGAGATGGKSK